jgi:hypothetical protein
LNCELSWLSREKLRTSKKAADEESERTARNEVRGNTRGQRELKDKGNSLRYPEREVTIGRLSSELVVIG